MDKLKNLSRTKFIAAILVAVLGLIEWKCPDLPAETMYGLLLYIGGESVNDALKSFSKKEIK